MNSILEFTSILLRLYTNFESRTIFLNLIQQNNKYCVPSAIRKNYINNSYQSDLYLGKAVHP